MVEVFNAICNIAVVVERDVFTNKDKFLAINGDDTEIEKIVYQHCGKIIEKEFEKVHSIHGVVGKNKKLYCDINSNGKYMVSYVAIDSPNLLDTNFSVGSIFGIYEGSFEAKNLKGAIYITYGPTFQLVFASKSEGVKFFSYRGNEFIQQDSFILNQKGNINSTAGLHKEWNQKHKNLIKDFFNDGYRLRFSNSLALDTHQILFKKGGIYSSPATISNPNGVLETVFEAYPIAFIIELAKGEAVNGKNRILDNPSQNIYSKTPIYFGSTNEIQRVLKL